MTLKSEHKKSYDRWSAMVQRCTNPASTAYKHYGGRGITVCDRWLNFEAFHADMGDAPEGLSMDRIDNDGNYEPSNIRWANPSEQQWNRRRLNKSHCIHGHLYDEANSYLYRGMRSCKACRSAYDRRRYVARCAA